MLNICKSFFGHLNSANIKYCHWKSNNHLEEALNGDTDLDILVHEDYKPAFDMAVEKFDMKKVLSPKEKQFPGMEDFLGFDWETGKFIHLHVHYKLVLGQKYIKNHHLPVESLMFENLSMKYGVYIPKPEIELILLVIRAHMKVETVSILKNAVKNILVGFSVPYPDDIEGEFNQLISCLDPEEFTGLLGSSNLMLSEKLFVAFIAKFRTKKITAFDIFILRRHIFSALSQYRRSTSFINQINYLYLLVRQKPAIRGLLKPAKKKLMSRGITISIVGADGSGKSTLTNDLNKWLSWKMTVHKFYYGIPKNWIVHMMTLTIRVLNKLHMAPASNVLISILWIYVARERYRIYRKTQHITVKGGIAVTDRFPLPDFQNMDVPMDGPRLHKLNSGICLFFAKTEESYYSRIKYPDRIVVLQVGPDELRKRKKDLALYTHKIKSEAVNRIEEYGPVNIVNANRPYHEVQLQVKRNIWKLLLHADRSIQLAVL